MARGNWGWSPHIKGSRKLIERGDDMEHTGCENCEHDISGITFCPMHAAAPALLKALEHVRTTLDNTIGDNELLETYLPPLLLDVRDAIKLAKEGK